MLSHNNNNNNNDFFYTRISFFFAKNFKMKTEGGKEGEGEGKKIVIKNNLPLYLTWKVLGEINSIKLSWRKMIFNRFKWKNNFWGIFLKSLFDKSKNSKDVNCLNIFSGSCVTDDDKPLANDKYSRLWRTCDNKKKII